jgi:hypothetical protein
VFKLYRTTIHVGVFGQGKEKEIGNRRGREGEGLRYHLGGRKEINEQAGGEKRLVQVVIIIYSPSHGCQ